MTKLPFGVMKTSLVGLPFVVGMAVATAIAVLHAVRRRRALGAGAAVMMAVLAAATMVNWYFAYLPNVGALLGQRAYDQASAVQVQARAEQAVAVSEAPLRGVVERVRIPGTVSGFRARPAEVYLPPAWFVTPRPRLPVIELLHGTPGTPEDWTRAGLADVTADRWAAAHGGRAPIIVMPDPNGGFTSDTECVDGSRGRAETYLTQDVPAWATANLGARADRAGWVIVGSSEGGYCALDLGLRHRDRYVAFADLSGLDRPTYPGGAQRLFRSAPEQLPQHDPRLVLGDLRRGPPMSAWFEVGTADGGNTRSVKAMAALAQAKGLDVHLELVPNAHHTWRVWRHSFTDVLPWAAWKLGLSPAVDPLPRR